MKKTKKQKRFESHHWLMYGFEYYKNLPHKPRLKSKRFKMQRFLKTVNEIKRNARHDLFGDAFATFNKGVSYNGRTRKFSIRTPYN